MLLLERGLPRVRLATPRGNQQKCIHIEGYGPAPQSTKRRESSRWRCRHTSVVEAVPAPVIRHVLIVVALGPALDAVGPRAIPRQPLILQRLPRPYPHRRRRGSLA